MDWLTASFSALLAAVIPALILAWQARKNRKFQEPLEGEKAKTEEASRVTAENRRLEARNKDLDLRIDAQDKQIDQLISEVRSLRTELATANARIAELERH